MKTLKLSDSKALELYKTANKELKEILEETFGKAFFKPKDVTRIVYDISTLERHTKDFKTPYLLSTKDKFEKYLNACYILAKVAEIYNEGIILDWKNTNIYKYIPYKYFSGVSCRVGPASYWYSFQGSSARLYYKDSNLSEASYINFKEYWEDYWSNN